MYISITIDTECDKSANWLVKKPFQFNNIMNGVAGFLQPLFEAYQVRPTYLLSPEVIAHQPSATYLRDLAGKAELGTHLHAEYIEPGADYSASVTGMFQSELSARAEGEKLENLTKLFRDTFGFDPKSFRAGRFGLGKNTLMHLQNLGYIVDSSITPDTWWMRSNTHGVNFLGAPYQPYHPSEFDYRKSGTMRILEIPVTTINDRLAGWKPARKRLFNPQRKFQRILLSRIIKPSENFRWLRPTFNSSEGMRKLISDIRNLENPRENKRPLFFCMMFHSNEFDLQTSPYSQTMTQLRQIKENLSTFLDRYASEFNFVSLSEIPNLMNGNQRNIDAPEYL